jgi:hypothetical protein
MILAVYSSVDAGAAMSRVRNWFERRFDPMSHEAAPEVHRIGPSGAHIVRVTQKRIEYTDAAGGGQFVDLEECARKLGAMVLRP